MTVCANISSIWSEDQPESKTRLFTPLGERELRPLFWLATVIRDASLMKVHHDELWHWEFTRRFDEALDMFRGMTTLIIPRRRAPRSTRLGGAAPAAGSEEMRH